MADADGFVQMPGGIAAMNPNAYLQLTVRKRVPGPFPAAGARPGIETAGGTRRPNSPRFDDFAGDPP